MANLFPGAFFFISLLISVILYWPGLSGTFLFDDFANLNALGDYGGVRDLQSLTAYLSNGISGPTGRPVALLSFLIDDNTWPSQAWGFKYTNLLLHLLNGCLLFWLIFRCLRLVFPAAAIVKAAWIAALAASLWLLHPFWVSTTLYVVQRMTQLAALFVLVGMIGYVHGRSLLGHRPFAAYAWMSVSLIAGTVLATYSKENGALLPLFILTLEYSLLSQAPAPRPARLWRAAFLLAPAVVLFLYLARFVVNADTSFARRFFTLPERLLTEARILVDYLSHLLIPRIQTRGLFHDNYPLSTSLTAPPETLIAVLALSGLFILGLYSRKRYPLLSAGLLFFFAGHLIESTVVPLELYFEHRNYLPAMLLFLPLAAWLVNGAQGLNKGRYIALTGALLIALSFCTWQRASLWGKTDELILVWADRNHTSVRAQRAAALQLESMGRSDIALRVIANAIGTMPDDILLRLHYLWLKSIYYHVDEEEFAAQLSAISRLYFDFRGFEILRTFVESVASGRASGIRPDDMHVLLDRLVPLPEISHSPGPARQIAHLHGLLYVHQNKPEAALESFNRAIDAIADVEAGLAQVAILGSRGLFDQALAHLERTEQALGQQNPNTLKRTYPEYRSEILRLRRVLSEDRDKASARQAGSAA